MSRSILRRIGGGIAAAALALTTLGAVGAATPAQAAACTTSVSITAGAAKNEYGAYNWVRAQTASSCGGSPWAGTTSIQRWTGSGWAPVAHGSASYASFSGSGKFNRTATYRAVYSGGASGSNTWSADASLNKTIGVFRKVNVRDRSTSRASVGVFKIRPAATIKGKKAKFQVKKAGGWKKYKNVRVGKRGNIRVSFHNSRKGIKYRMILPAARGMVKSKHGPFIATRR